MKPSMNLRSVRSGAGHWAGRALDDSKAAIVWGANVAKGPGVRYRFVRPESQMCRDVFASCKHRELQLVLVVCAHGECHAQCWA